MMSNKLINSSPMLQLYFIKKQGKTLILSDFSKVYPSKGTCVVDEVTISYYYDFVFGTFLVQHDKNP